MKLMNDCYTFYALSWPTLQFQLQKLARGDSEFLQHRLHEAPPDGGFVKANLLQRLLRSKFGPWDDVVKSSPREWTLDDIIQELKPLLEAETINDAADREALLPIKGATNYSSYVHSPRTVLAEGAKAMLEKEMRELPTTTFIFAERSTISAFEECYATWLQNKFHMDDAMDLLKDDSQALCLVLVRATSGHHVVITASYFVAYAENRKHDNRVKSVRAFLAALDLLQASGNLDVQHVLEQREICRAYLMGLT